MKNKRSTAHKKSPRPSHSTIKYIIEWPGGVTQPVLLWLTPEGKIPKSITTNGDYFARFERADLIEGEIIMVYQ